MSIMSASPTPSVTRSSTASSLTTLLTPSNPAFPPSVHIETSDGGSATPTRDSFFPPGFINPSKKDTYNSLHIKRKPFLTTDPTSLRRSVSASGATRRAKATLAMSIHGPTPSAPTPRPSGHKRTPSMSETLLRNIADKDDHRRGIHSSGSSAKSDYETPSRHRRRHSTSARAPMSLSPSPVTPHSQVLQARLERVLHTVSADPLASPLFRSHSSSARSRRSSRRFDDDKEAPPTLEDKIAAWNLPASPLQGSPASNTTTPKRKRYSMPHSPPSLTLHRSSLTTSPHLHVSMPRSPSFSLHHPPPPASPFLRSMSPRLLTTPPPTPPESPTEEASASDSSSSSTPPSDGFDPYLASEQCRKMTGYISFGEVEGLDAGRLCEGDVERTSDAKKGWRWRLWA